MGNRKVQILHDSSGLKCEPNPVGGKGNPPKIFPGDQVEFKSEIDQQCTVSLDASIFNPATLSVPPFGSQKTTAIAIAPNGSQYQVSLNTMQSASAYDTPGIIIVDPSSRLDDDDDEDSGGDNDRGKRKSGTKQTRKGPARSKAAARGKTQKTKAKPKTKTKGKSKSGGKPKAKSPNKKRKR
jgi:hypothetical protein